MFNLPRHRALPATAAVILTCVLISACGSSTSKKAASVSVSKGSDLVMDGEIKVDSGTASSPALATDPNSKAVYVSYVKDSPDPGPFGGSLGVPYMASSSDSGKTWSPSTQLTTDAAVYAQSPQNLAVTKTGSIIDNWAGYKADPATPYGDYNMEVARSDDHGKTALVSSPNDGGVQQVSRPGVTTGPDGQVWLSWLDGRPYDQKGDYLYDIRLSKSTDDGKTFTPSWTVKGNACQCCGPRISVSPTDPQTMALVWRDVVQAPGTENHAMQMDGTDADGNKDAGKSYAKTDNRKIKVAVSHDGGHDFGDAVSVNDFDWFIQACPTVAPSVFFDPTGKRLGVTWFNGNPDHTGTYYSESNDGGKTYSQPVKLASDIVGEGYDMTGSFDAQGNAWVGWADADDHVQAARITKTGELRETPKIDGTRVALTPVGDGAILSYSANGTVITRHVSS